MTIANTGQWIERAACRDADPEIFFPIGATGPAGELQAALRICGRCRVRSECLSFALETGQSAGVWGGLTEEQRRAVRKQALHGVR